TTSPTSVSGRGGATARPGRLRGRDGRDQRLVPPLLPGGAQHLVVVPEDAEGAAEPPALPGDAQRRPGGVVGAQAHVAEERDVHDLERLLDEVQGPAGGQVVHPERAARAGPEPE